MWSKYFFLIKRISKKLCRFLFMFSSGFTPFSVLLLFFSFDNLLCLYGRFLMLFYLTKTGLSPSTHHLMCLLLEALISIIRFCEPILVKLIDMVICVIIFLSQVTLLRYLIFVLGFLAVTLTVLPLRSYFFLLTLVFVLEWLSLYWEILLLLLSQFP